LSIEKRNGGTKRSLLWHACSLQDVHAVRVARRPAYANKGDGI
jgi:hypothetical protein